MQPLRWFSVQPLYRQIWIACAIAAGIVAII